MNFSPIRPKLVPIAIATLLGGLSATSYALPLVYGNLTAGQITLDAEYTMGVQYAVPPTTALTNGMDQAAVYTTAGGADMYLYQTDSNNNNNNVFFHTYGFTGNPTYFGARASGEGSFYATTFARYSKTFTNGSLLDQLYNFAFDVSYGELAITGAGAGYASLMLRVNVTSNGVTTTLAQDSTTLTQAIGGSRTCVESDQGSLASYFSCSASSGNRVDTFINGGDGGLFNVSLGSIGAGNSFTLDYDIIATVAGNLSYEDGAGGYGDSQFFNACGQFPVAQRRGGDAVDDELPAPNEGNEFVCEAPQVFPGMAVARSGDPFSGPDFGTGGASDTPFSTFRVSAANSVPEPGSLALLTLALTGLAATRRKK